MRPGLETLSDREKETLRLLLAGHDAKSIAQSLGLSVHTVNERLRDARRKVGASTSREVARLLAASEGQDPHSLGDKGLGVAVPASPRPRDEQSDQRRVVGHSLAWLGGGMLIMSLIIAAVALSSAFSSRDQASAPPPISLAAAEAGASQSAGIGAARGWVALVDSQRWDDSWSAAATLFRSQLTKENWAAAIKPVRVPLGAVSARAFKSVVKSKSLPGAPAGDYEIIEFATDFAKKPGAIETVIMAREGTAWKVAGYFIR